MTKKLDATKIRQLLAEKQLTQAVVAERIGVDQSTIAGWLNGRSNPTDENLTKLATILDKTIDDIQEYENSNNRVSEGSVYFSPTINPTSTNITINSLHIQNLVIPNDLNWKDVLMQLLKQSPQTSSNGNGSSHDSV